jgi:hypothetical protein
VTGGFPTFFQFVTTSGAPPAKTNPVPFEAPDSS